MEKRILGQLEWNLTVPTPFDFLTRFIKAATTPPKETSMEQMVYFHAELGLMNYKITRHCPLVIAATMVYHAQHPEQEPSVADGICKATGDIPFDGEGG